MIVVFPLLTDESISPNILPGLCKTLEKFILVYELDAIMKFTGSKIIQIGGHMAATAATSLIGKTTTEAKIPDIDFPAKPDRQLPKGYPEPPDKNKHQKEYDEYHKQAIIDIEKKYNKEMKDYTTLMDLALKAAALKDKSNYQKIQNKLNDTTNKLNDTRLRLDKFKLSIEAQKSETAAQKENREYLNTLIGKAKEDREREKYEIEKVRSAIKNVFDTLKNIKDFGTVDVMFPKSDSVSLEPTYVMATTGTGTKIIGIKVIPFPVKNKDKHSLAELLTAEGSLNAMDALTISISRKAIRTFWALCRGLHIPFLKDRVISGDPTRDILWASTFHKRFVYCLLNYADITNNEFFKNAGGIYQLHKMGWNSFIAADEPNKRAVFCMKQFHGLCSTIPYQFIYSSLGKDAAAVYDNLEDIKRKAASPFLMKMNTSIKKLAMESSNLLENYLKRIS